MKRYLLPALGILSVLILIAVIVFITLNPPKDEDEPDGDNRDVTQGQIDGDRTPSIPTGPGGVPAKEDIPDEILGENDGHGEDEHHDHESDTLLNMQGYEDLAVGAVREYVTYNTGETAADRTARLTPYFEPGSGYLTGKPRIALEDREKHHNWFVRAGVTGTPYAGLYRTNGNTFTFKVAADYWAEYYEPVGQTQQGSASWTVTIPFEKDSNGNMVLNATAIQSLSEPTLNME